MSQCRIYSCRHRSGSPCCSDCDEPDCMDRCQNAPDRCKCWSNIIPPKHGQRRAVYDHQQIVSLRAAGLQVAEIADRVGCSIGTVNTHLAKERKK